MPSSIFSSLLSTFDSRSIGEIASRLGEPERAVSQGLESSTAFLVEGLATKAHDSTWMSQLFKLISQAPPKVNVSDLTGAVTGSGQVPPATTSLMTSGKNFLSLVFGGYQSQVLDAIGNSTGLRSGVVSSLMTMAAPMMMSTLGRLVREDHMSQAGLSSLLIQEGEGVRSLLPAGYSTLFGSKPAPMMASTPAGPIAIGMVPEPAPSRPWLWLVPALLLCLPLMFWAYRTRHAAEVRGTAARDLGNFVPRTLPDKVTLNVPENGVESQLLGFVQDTSKGVSEDVWFDFDRLLFDTDSATPRPESREQLRNIAAILMAYPNTHLKVGGYTDSTGDLQHNQKLSQDRANAVMTELILLGVSPSRLEAQGYGEQHPVADNSTAEGRARNRRIAMRVTQK